MTCNRHQQTCPTNRFSSGSRPFGTFNHMGELRSWQIKRLEKIPGWTWTKAA